MALNNIKILKNRELLWNTNVYLLHLSDLLYPQVLGKQQMKTVQSPRSSGFFCVAGRGLRGLVLMAASLGAVGAAAEETQPTRLTWTTYASEAMPALDLQATQLRLVMFRPDGGPAPDVPAGVFVNGRLLSSLLPGGFADAVVCRHSWRAFLSDDFLLSESRQPGRRW